ncbi:MAG: DUF3616 domain-containing protein [Verrucomicrobiales bacterium]|nr:DUF3616 domain-containing protein [Verrucomicrobiales bacterium]
MNCPFASTLLKSTVRRLEPWLACWIALAVSAGAQTAPVLFRGICDASAVIPLPPHHQVVADDEDNILRVYDRRHGGSAVWQVDLSSFLQVDPKEPEVDIEAAARVGDRIYWVSSHGRNRTGKFRASRHRFFATELSGGPGHPTVVPVGIPSSHLLSDLLADARYAGFELARAAALPPKSAGALSIEGLAALPDGRLLLGFRNPQPGGRALLVPVENAAEIIAGQRARFGAPILLDLDRRGVRGLGTLDEQVIIAAGAHDNAPRTQFFAYHFPAGTARPLAGPMAKDLNPEAIEFLPDPSRVAWLIASDDGSVRIGKRECKKLKDPSQKQFRTVILEADPNAAARLESSGASIP